MVNFSSKFISLFWASERLYMNWYRLLFFSDQLVRIHWKNSSLCWFCIWSQKF